MNQSYYCLGLMSGTSMDGVDASIIKTNGKTRYSTILDKYYEYPTGIYNNLIKLKGKIKTSKDLKKYRKQIKLELILVLTVLLKAYTLVVFFK